MSEQSLLVRDVTLVDAEEGRQHPGWAVLVEDGRITRTGPTESLDGTAAESVVEGGGRFAVPGLIDAHIHLRAAPHVGPTDAEPTPGLAPRDLAEVDVAGLAQRAQTFLYCGVTSVYDAGNNSALIMAVRDAERTGAVLAPRVHCTGNLFTAPGGHGATASVAVGEDDDVARLVAEHAALGPDLVKITYDEHGWGVRPLVPILSQALLGRLIAEVHRNGLKGTVHVSNELRAREAVACGADVLAHPVIQSPMTPEFADRWPDPGCRSSPR